MDARVAFYAFIAWLFCSSSTAIAQTNWALLSAPVISPNEIALRVTGIPGSLYRIEVSTNLADWSKLALTINETGTVSLQAAPPAPSSRTFYRVVVDSPLHRMAEAYCRRAEVVSSKAKLALYEFVEGLDSLGLTAHLSDFAFFCQGMQPRQGNPVSYTNSGTIIGSIGRWRGGFALPNVLATNCFYFTNLPPTPSGRTLVLWAAGNMNYSGISQDNGVALIELAAGGGWPQAMVQMFYSNGGYSPYNWDGAVQRIGPAWYGYSGYENSLFCLGLSSSASGYEACLKRDNRRVFE